MKQQIIDLLNNHYVDDKEYTGFTLLAHNEDGLRLVCHNVSAIELMLQSKIIEKEIKEAIEESEVSDVQH